MKKILIFCLLMINLAVFPQNKEMPVKTEVEEVTVFINGAQVVRKKTLEIQQGTSILKFTELSPYIDPKSIQIKVNGEVMVLSVNHQYNYLDSAKKSRELEELSTKLKQIDKKIELENVTIEILNEQLNFIKENKIIGGKNQELSLNNFKETSIFYGEKVSGLKMKLIELNNNIEALSSEKSNITKQISQITTNKTLPVSEILVKISAIQLSKCSMELSYLVKNAGWFPSYDIRSNSIDEPVQIVYKANIHQNTKEDWKQVKLKLSSSDPNSGSVAPQLMPYFLNYNTLPPKYSNINNQVSGRVYDATTNEPLIGASIKIKGTTIGTLTDMDGNYSISIPNNNSELEINYIGYESQSRFANNATINFSLQPSVQSLDEVVIVGNGTKKSALQGRTAGVSIRGTSENSYKSKSLAIPVEQTENQTSFEFEIKTPYTLSSGNKNLTVDIENYLLEATYEYQCVPKIDKDAFLIANVVNWEKYNLLEGEANIFFENTFIGKSILDVRYISDTLKLSLGRDKNVIVKREKIKDFTKKQLLGTKKEETRAWMISVKNNKKQAITLNLFDQVPVSTNDEIEVQVEETSGGILKSDIGEINWNLKLNPTDKKDLQLKYLVKYPKNRIITLE